MNEPTYGIWSRNSDRGGTAVKALYDEAFQRIDLVEDYSKLSISKRWGESSTWSMELPWDEFRDKWNVPTNTETLISDDYGLRGILIFRNGGEWPLADDSPTHYDGNLILSGPITSAIRDSSGLEDTVTLSGESDTYYLKTRNTWPHNETAFYWDRANEPPNKAVYSGTPSYWSYTGSLAGAYYQSGYGGTGIQIEYACRGFVKATLGTAAYIGSAGRRLRFFSEGYNGTNVRGNYVTYWSRFEPVYEVVQKLIKMQANQYKYGTTEWIDATKVPFFGFDIIQVSDTASGIAVHETHESSLPGPDAQGPTTCRLLFRFLTPRDNTAENVFGTDLGDIKRFVYEEQAPEMTACFIDGPNWDITKHPASTSTNDLQRLYASWPISETDEAATKYGWIEGYESASNLETDPAKSPTVAKFKQRMQDQAKIAIMDKSYSIAATIELDTSMNDHFMTNFQLGDYITINREGNVYTDFIREINIDLTPDGERITPIVSDPWSYWRRGSTSSTVKTNATRLNDLRNWKHR